jgi:hypothetical protein
LCALSEQNRHDCGCCGGVGEEGGTIDDEEGHRLGKAGGNWVFCVLVLVFPDEETSLEGKRHANSQDVSSRLELAFQLSCNFKLSFVFHNAFIKGSPGTRRGIDAIFKGENANHI